MYFNARVVQVICHFYLVLKALVDQNLLPLSTIHGLSRVCGDQSIEKGIELIKRIIFRPHNPSHSLNLLPARTMVHAYLNTYICAGQVNSSIAYSTHKQYIELFYCLESSIEMKPFLFRYVAVNKWLFKYFSIFFKDFRPITEY